MDDLKIESAHLAGHSMGSHVAMLLARSHRERVKSITSICSSAESPFETMFHTTLFRHVFDVVKNLHDKNADKVEELWKKFAQNNAFNRAIVGMTGFNRKLATTHDVGIYLDGVQQVPFLVLKALLDDMARNPLLPLLHDIQTPTLIVSGEKDFVQPPINQKKLYEHLPRAQWLSIPFGSHCAHVDMHEFVNLRMEKFLSEQEA
jgi:pimeloyl-ACP methyl ester carboxylesterase